MEITAHFAHRGASLRRKTGQSPAGWWHTNPTEKYESVGIIILDLHVDTSIIII